MVGPRLGLVLLSVVLVLVLLELGLRAVHRRLLDWRNLVLGARTVHSANEHRPLLHDALAGLRAAPRRLAPRPPSRRAPSRRILAVGDSYTHGDEVGDGETWPAHLQRLTAPPRAQCRR